MKITVLLFLIACPAQAIRVFRDTYLVAVKTEPVVQKGVLDCWGKEISKEIVSIGPVKPDDSSSHISARDYGQIARGDYLPRSSDVFISDLPPDANMLMAIMRLQNQACAAPNPELRTQSYGLAKLHHLTSCFFVSSNYTTAVLAYGKVQPDAEHAGAQLVVNGVTDDKVAYLVDPGAYVCPVGDVYIQAFSLCGGDIPFISFSETNEHSLRAMTVKGVEVLPRSSFNSDIYSSLKRSPVACASAERVITARTAGASVGSSYQCVSDNTLSGVSCEPNRRRRSVTTHLLRELCARHPTNCWHRDGTVGHSPRLRAKRFAILAMAGVAVGLDLLNLNGYVDADDVEEAIAPVRNKVNEVAKKFTEFASETIESLNQVNTNFEQLQNNVEAKFKDVEQAIELNALNAQRGIQSVADMLAQETNERKKADKRLAESILVLERSRDGEEIATSGASILADTQHTTTFHTEGEDFKEAVSGMCTKNEERYTCRGCRETGDKCSCYEFVFSVHDAVEFGPECGNKEEWVDYRPVAGGNQIYRSTAEFERVGDIEVPDRVHIEQLEAKALKPKVKDYVLYAVVAVLALAVVVYLYRQHVVRKRAQEAAKNAQHRLARAVAPKADFAEDEYGYLAPVPKNKNAARPLPTP
jgi:hypothetical protein